MSEIENKKDIEKINYRKIDLKVITSQNSPKCKKIYKIYDNTINYNSNSAKKIKEIRPTKIKPVITNINKDVNKRDISEDASCITSRKNIKNKKLKKYNFSPNEADDKGNSVLLRKLKNIKMQANIMKDELNKCKKLKKVLNNNQKKTINNNNNFKTIKNIDTSKNFNDKKIVTKKFKYIDTNDISNIILKTQRKTKKTVFNINELYDKKILTDLIYEILNEKNNSTMIENNPSSKFFKYKNNELKNFLTKKTKNEIQNKSAENRKKKKLIKNFNLSYKKIDNKKRIIKTKSRSYRNDDYSNDKIKNISPIKKIKYNQITGKTYQKQAHTKNIFYTKKGKTRLSTNANSKKNLYLKKENKEKIHNKTSSKISNSLEKVKKETSIKNIKSLHYKAKSQQDISVELLTKNIKKVEEEVIVKDNFKEKEILKIEKLCKKGFAGEGVEKKNQDNYFIYSNFNNDASNIYMGVCDGHGTYGQEISTFLVTNLPLVLGNFLRIFNIKDISSTDCNTLLPIIKNSFNQINKNLILEKPINCSLSGSTCNSLIYTPKKVFCLNLGDSRCILGKFDGKKWESKDLSIDHKPDLEKEKERILNSGGIVQQSREENGEFVGPFRVWVKDADIPGLAMSRSFGDKIAHQVGVICDPDIVEYELKEEDKFIILASDGIWEFISSQECVDIVKDYYINENYKGAVKHLYKESCNRWLNEEEVIDDITIIIVFFN